MNISKEIESLTFLKISNIWSIFFTIFLFSLFFLFLTRKITKKIGLVDKPNYRKQHDGDIPLAGGISIYASMFITFLGINCYIPYISLYLICAGILVITGILDDRFNISITIRAIIQAIVTIIMITFSGKYISSLGVIFGSYELLLGNFGYIITLIMFWAIINSFNMIDGIDGLLGGLSCVSFVAISILLILNNNFILALWCMIMIITILPFILMNIGIFGKRFKIFMGDSGSTMIGFTIIWLLLQITQGTKHLISPVTGLWIIAIPLMDMINIMYRRICNGINPFTPDRQHLHHLFIYASFSSYQTFIIITIIATILASFGIIGEYLLHLSEWTMMILWIIIFLFYGYILKYAWKRVTRLATQEQFS